MAITYINLASTILSSGQTSISFSSINQTFTDLLIKYTARTDLTGADVTDTFSMTFNSNGNSIYTQRAIRFFGSGNAGDQITTPTIRYMIYGGANANGGSTANTFTNGEIYIPNYTTTTAKQVELFYQTENAATEAYNYRMAGSDTTNAAITSIQLFQPASRNFLAGSSFYLYGIKRA